MIKLLNINKIFLINVKQKYVINFYSVLQTNNYSSAYKSDLSLEKLYPNSKLKIFTPQIQDLKLQSNGKFSGVIPLEQLEITYSRSSGPGGQNVNCVNTKVDLRFKVDSANWISEKVKQRLLNDYGTKINKNGYFVLKSDITRSQQLNLAYILNKLREIIRALEIEAPTPTEESLEKIRRRQERASRERLAIKKHRSQIKTDRQSPVIDF